MKIICAVLGMLMFLNAGTVSASTGLKEILDNYQYSIEVEWDQQDQNQLNLIQHKFNSDIQNLLAESESPELIMENALLMVRNEKLRQEMAEVFATSMQNNLHPEDVQNHLLKIITEDRAQGASWSIITKIAIGGIVTLVVARVVIEVYFYFWKQKF